MKLLFLLFSGLVFFLIQNTPTYANTPPMGAGMGLPTYGGTGCPQGTVGANLSPDNKQLSILFDEYIIELGEFNGQKRGRKNCQISIPFIVPPDHKMTIVQMDFRGYNSIPAQGRVRFNSQFTISKEESDRERKLQRVNESFIGPIDDEYFVSARLHDRRWSRCGQDFELNIDLTLMAATNQSMDELISTVDSLDTDIQDAKVKYYLVWQKCRKRQSRVHERNERNRKKAKTCGRARRDCKENPRKKRRHQNERRRRS